MSEFLNIPHVCTLLMASTVVDLAAGAQTIKIPIVQNKIYDRYILRTKMSFEHGNEKAKKPKFGGIYNLLRSVAVVINNDQKHYVNSGQGLYRDTFIRSGRENNELNYADLPTEFVQNIDYCFGGRQTVFGGVVVPDGAFALDVRHSNAGPATYNSLDLVIELGTLSDVFGDVNDTTLTGLTFEVHGVEMFHNQQSQQALAIDKKRHAEIIIREENRKVADITLPQSFILEAVGEVKNGIYLSDFVITQTDEAGMPIPFTDENEVVTVTVNGLTFCSSPIWDIQRKQNNARLQAVPPNMLVIPLVQAQTGLGGLSPANLFSGAAVTIKANKLDGQTGETMLSVCKTYSHKPV